MTTTSIMDNQILTHGSPSLPPEGVLLRAGRLSLIYEAGFIRYISNGSQEIVRMVNHYLRDQNWNTIPMRIESEQVSTTADSFIISYSAFIKRNDIDFSWQCTITGSADETVMFSIEGQAHSDFRRNRLGLTILLPTASLRGQTCRLTRPNNSTVELLFPDAIEPHQPFLDIQAMAWAPSSGLQAAMTFQGDVFEMEDQRNWMDASHKVYCTPLELGFPKEVKKGDHVAQSVHLKVFGDLHQPARNEDVVSFSIDTMKGVRLPAIGIPLSGVTMTGEQRERIQAIHPDFVSVVIKHVHQVQDRMAEALQFERPVEVVLFPASARADEWALALKPYAAHIAHVVLLVEGKRSADSTLLEGIVPPLRKHLPKTKIGSGTDAFFTELNRNRTPAQALDFLSFSVNPQCHASDLRTMTENLAAHSDVVESCRALSGGRDVRVGPVTLKMRWNPDAIAGENQLTDGLRATVDARQLSLYAAAWTLGSLKYLSESGASIVSFYEMAGWHGLMAHPDEPWPAAFDVNESQVYPVYVMLRLLLAQRGSVVLPLKSSQALSLDGMAFRADREMTVLLANYTRLPLRVTIPHSIRPSGLLLVGNENIRTLLDTPLSLPATEPFDGDSCAIPPFGFAMIKGHEPVVDVPYV